MKKELKLRYAELQNQILPSLYFGGGTPSVLDIRDIQSLIDEVLKYFDFDRNIEITLEANPDDLDSKFLKELSQTAINRLSIGIQSFDDKDLKLMNRVHNASQAESAIKRAQDFGFENQSIDLIYGSPVSDFKIWKENLHKTIAFQIPHISSYALTIEPKTALNSWMKKKKIPAPKEALQSKEFYYMTEFLKDQGMHHYEISNFAKPGWESRHNSAYWEHREYLGIGPSAHSYNGSNQRSWNIANNSLYIKKISENQQPIEIENLTEKDQFNEMLMIGLRTAKGVNIKQLNTLFSDKILEHYRKEVKKKLKYGQLTIEQDFLKIPEKHWFMADGIASDLFII